MPVRQRNSALPNVPRNWGGFLPLQGNVELGAPSVGANGLFQPMLHYIVGTTTTQPNLSANVLRAWPIVLRRSGILNRLSFEVTAGVAGNCRVGIYRARSLRDIYPSKLLMDSGDISTISASYKNSSGQWAAFTPIPMYADVMYWFAHIGSVQPTFRACALNMTPILGWEGTTPPISLLRALQVNLAYGALPDPFPTPLTSLNAIEPMLVGGQFST